MKINEVYRTDGLHRAKRTRAGLRQPGLLIEPDHAEVSRVLVALDCTKAVAEEAVGVGR
ncbi:MAG: Nif3-like dinuclear metal center hexameric protein [Eubacteriales bacterium]